MIEQIDAAWSRPAGGMRPEMTVNLHRSSGPVIDGDRHVSNILCKLDVSSRTAAPLVAVRNGIIRSEDASS